MLKAARLRERPPPKGRPLCVVCGERPACADHTSGGRCETCWAEAARDWVWNGATVNAFRVRARRSGCTSHRHQRGPWTPGKD